MDVHIERFETDALAAKGTRRAPTRGIAPRAHERWVATTTAALYFRRHTLAQRFMWPFLVVIVDPMIGASLLSRWRSTPTRFAFAQRRAVGRKPDVPTRRTTAP